eukprot:TRINITY_DN17477_c1_g1_i6.p1 TRINITY_DN17477_c1_g1~~TRINITY_DN17477_c1_g1_i6.p1  ORF type:complete len:379 (-),score=24.25 TRINITY_DN17477_c1_g1_i6:168-1304(-)
MPRLSLDANKIHSEETIQIKLDKIKHEEKTNNNNYPNNIPNNNNDDDNDDYDQQYNKYNCYTTDRYALYLRNKIGAGTEFQNQKHDNTFEQNLKTEDVWIQLYKFIYIKAIALAEKSDGDAVLKIGEFWIIMLTIQLVISIILVTGPSIYLFFYLRFFIFIIVYLIYYPLLYWMLLNTRMEHVQKPVTGLFRLFLAVSDIFAIIFVFFKCPPFNSQISMFILINFYVPLIIYMESLVSSGLDFRERVKHTLGQYSGGSDFMTSAIFLFKLFQVYRKPIIYVYLVVLVLGQIPEMLEIVASKKFSTTQSLIYCCLYDFQSVQIGLFVEYFFCFGEGGDFDRGVWNFVGICVYNQHFVFGLQNVLGVYVEFGRQTQQNSK